MISILLVAFAKAISCRVLSQPFVDKAETQTFLVKAMVEHYMQI